MKPKTNTQFVRDLMEFSDYGATAQLVVMEAIRFYTQMMVSQPRPERDPEDMSFMPKDHWWDVNADIHRQMMARLHPEHAKEIEKELKERESAEKLGVQARNLVILEEWKKRQ